MLDFALLPLFFLTGIATSIQPCLLPLLPTFVSFLAVTPSANPQKTHPGHLFSIKHGVLISLFLTLGIMVVFLFLAFLLKLGQFWLSSFLIRYTVEFNFILAVILLLLGLLMLSNRDITVFYKVPALIPLPELKQMENKLVASFLLGLVYTMIAAPCAAPIFLSFFTSILFLDPMSVFIFIIVYTLGATLPFLVIGTLSPNLVKNDKIKKYVKPISGILLLIISFYLLSTYVLPYYPIIPSKLNITYTYTSSCLINNGHW